MRTIFRNSHCAAVLIALYLLFTASFADAAPPGQPHSETAGAEVRPNFVVIVSDDQSWVGSSLQIIPDDPRTRSDYFRTPNIERLAARGHGYQGSAGGHFHPFPPDGGTIYQQHQAGVDGQSLCWGALEKADMPPEGMGRSTREVLVTEIYESLLQRM